MSNALLVTFCFDIKYQTPNLKDVLKLFLSFKVEELGLIKYIENKVIKRIDKVKVPLINSELNFDTKDFYIGYEWKENEINLIVECASEIRKYIESDKDHFFNFFAFDIESGAIIERENEIFEEVKDHASNFIIYFYTEVSDVIHYKVNLEEILRNNQKVQKLISIIEKELCTKVIKIGINYGC